MTYTNIIVDGIIYDGGFIPSDYDLYDGSIEDLEFFRSLFVGFDLSGYNDIDSLKRSLIFHFEKSIFGIKRRFGSDNFLYSFCLDEIPLDRRRDSKIDVLLDGLDVIEDNLFQVELRYSFDKEKRLNVIRFCI